MVKDEEELHRLQRAFREVLGAYARPGTVHRVEATPQDAARPAEVGGHLETVARMLVDQAVTFCVVDGAPEAAASYLADETHARRSLWDVLALPPGLRRTARTTSAPTCAWSRCAARACAT